MILPAEVVAELQQIPAVSVAIAECVSADDDVIADVLSEQVPSECDVTSSPMSDAEVTNVESVNHSSQSGETMEDDSSKLMHEQQQDETMSDCWSMARLNKGNPVISHGLLYRKDEVEGQPICQMCVPVARHDVILKPVDCSRPLEPPSAQGHNYCLHSCVLLLCFVIWCLCVMTECIAEFGMMLLYDIVADESVMPSVRVESEQVQQRDEIADCFSVKPGLCDVVAHRIVTTPEFVFKQMRPYRVPVAFWTEVNRQIRELLDVGLIRPYTRDCAPKSDKLLCWTLAVQEFDLEIKYKRGTDNVVADYLSRHA